MTFKVGEKAYIVENHSYVTPVDILRSYGDFYTVAVGGTGINLRASRLFKTREDAERTLPGRKRTVASKAYGSSETPYDFMDYHSPYGL
jgi:hypothetical protein